ncbi:MAG: HAD family hydrolase [Methanobacteriota archaeon]
MKVRAIAVDMDNTLLVGRTLIALGRSLGLGERLLDLVRANGKVERCHLVASHLSGMPVSRLDEIVRQIPLDPGAPTLVAAARRAGVPIVVVTDSFTQAGRAATARLALSGLVANPLEVRAGRFTGRVLDWRVDSGIPASSPVVDKREALDGLSAAFGIPPASFCMIGDGKHDAEAMEVAGLGIAIRPQPGVAERADHVVQDLGQAAGLIFGHDGG